MQVCRYIAVAKWIICKDAKLITPVLEPLLFFE
jgi:hypothetical protein